MTNVFRRGAPLGGADLSNLAANPAAEDMVARTIRYSAWVALLQSRIVTTTVGVTAFLSRPAAAQELLGGAAVIIRTAARSFGTTPTVPKVMPTHLVARRADWAGWSAYVELASPRLTAAASEKKDRTVTG